jgi:2-phosphosulfolactate phosphatase
MRIDAVVSPAGLEQSDLALRDVVVFDVLRATTTMAAALAAGVKEIRIFPEIDETRTAAGGFDGPRLLCGERQCLPPPGFDLGNSPGAFSASHAGRTLFMCTTNGTRAIIAAQRAGGAFIGALVNAGAVAERLAKRNRDVTLLCAGTDNKPALEDLLGAGAVLDALSKQIDLEIHGDVARIARRLFQSARHDLRSALRESQGGRNLIAVELEADIDFCARLDCFDVVGEVARDPPRVRCSRDDEFL